jgi:guanylate kinase
MEYREAAGYDYIVLNDDVSSAVLEINSIIIAEKCKTNNRLELIKEMC